MDVAVYLHTSAGDELYIVVWTIAFVSVGSSDGVEDVALLLGSGLRGSVGAEEHGLAHGSPVAVGYLDGVVGGDSDLFIASEGKQERFAEDEGLSV